MAARRGKGGEKRGEKTVARGEKEGKKKLRQARTFKEEEEKKSNDRGRHLREGKKRPPHTHSQRKPPPSGFRSLSPSPDACASPLSPQGRGEKGAMRGKEKRKKRRTAWALKGEGIINKA